MGTGYLSNTQLRRHDALNVYRRYRYLPNTTYNKIRVAMINDNWNMLYGYNIVY